MNAKMCKKLRKIVKAMDHLSSETVYEDVNHGIKMVRGKPTLPVTVRLSKGCSRKVYKDLKNAQ